MLCKCFMRTFLTGNLVKWKGRVRERAGRVERGQKGFFPSYFQLLYIKANTMVLIFTIFMCYLILFVYFSGVFFYTQHTAELWSVYHFLFTQHKTR